MFNFFPVTAAPDPGHCRVRHGGGGHLARGIRDPDAALGWARVGFVWACALAWFVVTDRVKLLAYRALDPVRPEGGAPIRWGCRTVAQDAGSGSESCQAACAIRARYGAAGCRTSSADTVGPFQAVAAVGSALTRAVWSSTATTGRRYPSFTSGRCLYRGSPRPRVSSARPRYFRRRAASCPRPPNHALLHH